MVFDPDTVEPLPLQTLDDIPGGGTRMTKARRASRMSWVNGEVVVDAGTATAAVPGAIWGGAESLIMARPLPLLRGMGVGPRSRWASCVGDAGARQVADAVTAVVNTGRLTPGGVILLRRD